MLPSSCPSALERYASHAGSRLLGGADRFEWESLDRALVHVVQDAIDGGNHASRVRSEAALNRDELVGIPFAIASGEHRVYVSLEGEKVAHVDRTQLHEDLLGHTDIYELCYRAEQREIIVVVVVAAQ